MFDKLDTSSIKDRALKALEEKLLSGEFLPGDRLPPERDIAEEMGVSRAIVSMCMLELEAKGFVKSVPRQGTFVMDYMKNGTPAILGALMHYEADRMQKDLFDSLMACRIHIECECARLAAARACAEELEELRDILEQMKLFCGGEQFLQLDFEFHHRLCAAGGNAVYAMIVKSFEGAIAYFQKLAYGSAQSREISIEKHGKLLEALSAGEAEAAAELTRDIIASGVRTLEKIFKGS